MVPERVSNVGGKIAISGIHPFGKERKQNGKKMMMMMTIIFFASYNIIIPICTIC